MYHVLLEYVSKYEEKKEKFEEMERKASFSSGDRIARPPKTIKVEISFSHRCLYDAFSLVPHKNKIKAPPMTLRQEVKNGILKMQLSF